MTAKIYPNAFGAISKQITSSLKDQSESYLEKRSNARIKQLIAHMNIEKPSNAREPTENRMLCGTKASWISSFLGSSKGQAQGVP